MTMNLAGTPVARAAGGKGHRTKKTRLRAQARHREHLARIAKAQRPARDDER